MASSKSVPIAASTVFSSPVHFLAFGLGSGLAPKAPGTFGTLAAVPFYWLLAMLPLWAYGAVVMMAAIVGVWICGESSRRLGVHDHSGIVWDEFVGLWITLFAAPQGWLWLIAGFALFRLFDIWKPWPIRVADHQVSGGFGIMLDDILAGLYALASLQLLAWFVAR